MEFSLPIYFLSSWGIITNILILLVFGLKTYDVFAKLWLARTGRFTQPGKITYSEFTPIPKYLQRYGQSEGIVSYSFRVNGHLFNGTIPLNTLTEELVAERYQRGDKVTVFYSPRLPQYSFVDRPPTLWRLANDAATYWLLIPWLALNGLSMFIWFLANQ